MSLANLSSGARSLLKEAKESRLFDSYQKHMASKWNGIDSELVDRVTAFSEE
jgi:hypothetical protein